jgi:uncharacterized membrane protein
MICDKAPPKNNKLPIILSFAVFIVFAMPVVVMNLSRPITYTMYESGTIFYEKGKIIEILEEKLEPAPGMPGRELGRQTVIVKMTNGAMKGQKIMIDNDLSTTHNIRVDVGQNVIVKADRPEGVTPFYSLYNYDRTPGLLTVGLIFVAIMCLVGQYKGLRGALGLGVSLFFILCFLLPAIYHGYSPVLMAAVTVIIIAAFSMLLLNGYSRKTIIAIAATGVGVLVSAVFFFLLSALLSLSGYNIDAAEDLIVISNGTGLQIGQVLFAGVLVASLGAVMDMCISVASALYEIKKQRPDATGREIYRSGMAIGRDMIGAMCQTLVLAFMGSSLSTLLVLVSYGAKPDQFLSSDFVAVETVHSVAGSLATIFAVPITAGLCAGFLSRRKPAGKEQQRMKRLKIL